MYMVLGTQSAAAVVTVVVIKSRRAAHIYIIGIRRRLRASGGQRDTHRRAASRTVVVGRPTTPTASGIPRLVCIIQYTCIIRRYFVISCVHRTVKVGVVGKLVLPRAPQNVFLRRR